MTDYNTHLAGYANSAYARCFEHLGDPIHLRRCNGWIIRRGIGKTRLCDAMGCYPLFSCHDWSALQADLERLDKQLVSLSMVTDPFGTVDEALLRRVFPDLVIPFKSHFVVDLSRPFNACVSNHHRRNARKAAKILEVSICDQPIRFIDDWVALYACLTKRHRITGIRAFPQSSILQQLHVPGITAFRATHRGDTVGMVLWYIDREIGNYHLAAYTEHGYKYGASFAIFAAALRHFSAIGLRWLNLQGAAGISSDPNSGLQRFKAGWSTGVRQAYFCGRIFDHATYQCLSGTKRTNTIDYFPAYRAGEFV